MGNETIKNVHTEHCCIRHGCKYGDSDCPVVTGALEQSYPCEDCNDNSKVVETKENSLVTICCLCLEYKPTTDMKALLKTGNNRIIHDSDPKGHEFSSGMIYICNECVKTIKCI